MPSKDELDSMRVNLYLKSKGSFTDGFYWSSSEFDANNAWFQYFGNGLQDKYGKNHQFYVRAMRAF